MAVLFGERSRHSFVYFIFRTPFLWVVIVFLLFWLFVVSHPLNYPDTEISTFPSGHFLTKQLWSVESKVEDPFLSTQRRGGSNRRNSSSVRGTVGENDRARTPFTALFFSPFHLSHSFSFTSYFHRLLRGVDSGGAGDVNNEGKGKEGMREIGKEKTEERRERSARNGRIWSAVRQLSSVLYHTKKSFRYRPPVMNSTRWLHVLNTTTHFNAVTTSSFPFSAIQKEKEEQDKRVEPFHSTVLEEDSSSASSSSSFPSATPPVHLPGLPSLFPVVPTTMNAVDTGTVTPLSFVSSVAHAVTSHVRFVVRTIMPSLRSTPSDADRYDLTLEGNGVTVLTIAVKKGQRVETVAQIKEHRYNASVPLNNCLYYTLSVDLRSTPPFPSTFSPTTTTTTSSMPSVFFTAENEWRKWSTMHHHNTNGTTWGVGNRSRTSSKTRSSFSWKDPFQKFTVLRDSKKDREEVLSTVHLPYRNLSRAESDHAVLRGLPSFMDALQQVGEDITPTTTTTQASTYANVQGAPSAWSSIALLLDDSILCATMPSVALRSSVQEANETLLYYVIYGKKYLYEDEEEEDNEEEEEEEEDNYGDGLSYGTHGRLDAAKEKNAPPRLATASSVRRLQEAVMWGNTSVTCEMTVFVGRETEPLASVLRYVFALALPFLVVVFPLPFQLRYPTHLQRVLADEEFGVFIWAPCLLLQYFLFDRGGRVWRWLRRHGRELRRRMTVGTGIEVTTTSLPLAPPPYAAGPSPSTPTFPPRRTTGHSRSLPCTPVTPPFPHSFPVSRTTSPRPLCGGPLHTAPPSPGRHTECAAGGPLAREAHRVHATGSARERRTPLCATPSSSLPLLAQGKEEGGRTMEGGGDGREPHPTRHSSLLWSAHATPPPLFDPHDLQWWAQEGDRTGHRLPSPLQKMASPTAPSSLSFPESPSTVVERGAECTPSNPTLWGPTRASGPLPLLPSTLLSSTTAVAATKKSVVVAVDRPHDDDEDEEEEKKKGGGRVEATRRGEKVGKEEEEEEDEVGEAQRAIASGEGTGSWERETEARLPPLERASHSLPHHPHPPPPPPASSPLCARLSSSAVSNVSLKMGVVEPSLSSPKEVRKIVDEGGGEGAGGVVVVGDEKLCRICQDGDAYEDVIAPCECTGTVRWIHRSCLDQWRLESVNRNPHYVTHCELCHKPFTVMIKRSTLLEKQLSSFIYKFLFVLSCFVVYTLFNVSVRDPLGKYTCAAFYHKEVSVSMFSLDGFFLFLWIYICCMYGIFFAKTVVFSYFLNRQDTRQYMEEMPMTAPPVSSLFWTRCTVVWIGIGFITLVLQALSLGYIFKYFLFVTSHIPWSWEGAPFMGTFFLVLLLALLLRLQVEVSENRGRQDEENSGAPLSPAPSALSSSARPVASRSETVVPPSVRSGGTVVVFPSPSVSTHSNGEEATVMAEHVGSFPSDSDARLPLPTRLPLWKRIQRMWTDRDPREDERRRGRSVTLTDAAGNNGVIEERVDASAGESSLLPPPRHPSLPVVSCSHASQDSSNHPMHDPNDVEYRAHFEIPPDQRIIRAYEYCPPTRVKAPWSKK